MVAEMVHGSIHFVIKSKETGKTENLRRNHNWYAKGKDWQDAKSKEEKRFKKEWNEKASDLKCISVSV